MLNKIVALAVMLLFMGLTIAPSTGFYVVEQFDFLISDGNTLYVGGSGPGNYTEIQDAIDNASNGDMVYVYDNSSPYYENLIVDKSISLIGEDRNTTIIDGKNDRDVVNITADGVTVSGFTIQNYGNGSNNVTSLIFIQSDYNVISGNIIIGNIWCGIYIFFSEYSTISGNIIGEGLAFGIALADGINNNISGNIIKGCKVGIQILWYSNNNSIFGNIITNNTWGILTGTFCINDVISLNNISYNKMYGIIAMNCFNYKITKNNFIGNLINARFAYFLLGAFTSGFEYKVLRDIRSTIKWDGNYWNKPRSLPKPISGRLPPSGAIPWVQFDWNPAQEPYEITI